MQFNALYPELIVANIERSTHFYTSALGFKIEYSRPEERFQFLSFGKAQLMLLEDNHIGVDDTEHDTGHSRTGPMEYPRGQGVNFSISAPDVAFIAKALELNNYPIRIPVRDQWHRQNKIEHGEKQLWVMDPDGYLLRFIESLGSRDVTT